jgi:murein DD-endopeptidase MepM/ murein hydrolase activator NlpD
MPPIALLLLAVALAKPAPAPSPLAVEVHARAFLPGEPLRIVVTPDAALARASGALFGSELDLVRDGDRWIGWAVVGLDRKPGRYVLRVKGTLASGGSVAADIPIAVGKKAFPVQKLTVEPKYVEPPKEALERIARERALLDAIYARRSAALPLDTPFVRPVPGEPTSAFGLRRVFNGKPRAPHGGLDLRAATGTSVRASGPGTVAYAGDLYYSGLTVVIDHGAGLFSLYAHLSEIAVAEGASIAAGEAVGLSGATGRVTGPHLHWGARVGAAIFDPRALLDARLFGRE